MQRLYSLFQCSAACAGYEPVPKVICGIGAMLEPNSSDELVVADLVPGGPAELSGLLEVGDVLHEVDGVDVYKRPAKEVGEFIRGEVGTTICLGLAKKKCGSNTVYIEQVELTRGEATLPDKKTNDQQASHLGPHPNCERNQGQLRGWNWRSPWAQQRRQPGVHGARPWRPRGHEWCGGRRGCSS
mmetsp:Transcript_20630/g.44679  ORF Transcript_20630/g.44679 Transcript_20630/m.44679 type:complete len:185 (-) Transcript_20630:334-888(-)